MSMAYSRSYDAGAMARKSMLRMAKMLRQKGHVYQAIYILKQAMVDYPNNPESRIAMQEYVEVGEFLENKGMIHTAWSMYQWLEQLSRRAEQR